MAYSWYKVKHLTSSQIGNLDDSMAENLLNDMLGKLHNRQDQYAKAGQLFYSPAYQKLQEGLQIWNYSQVDDANLNAKKRAIKLLRNFFNAETSTVKGARRVMIEQDKLIFGVNEKGATNNRMNYQERSKFWSIAEEYERSHGAQYALNYRTIWDVISDMVIDDRDRSMRSIAQETIITQERLEKIEKLVREQINNEEPDTTPNIFSGRWNDKQRRLSNKNRSN